jgi:hypothetical protein
MTISITSFNRPNTGNDDEDDGKKLWSQHENILTALDSSIIRFPKTNLLRMLHLNVRKI